MLEIGDVVELNSEEIINFFKVFPEFYTHDTFTIIDINDRDVAILDKNLNSEFNNLIHISFLKKSLRAERKKKMQKINAKFR
jgi:hypothetical protein